MKIPTEQELETAYAAMFPELADDDLAGSMGRLAAENPMLQYQITMLADQAVANPVGGGPGNKEFLRTAIAGALMYGMQLGIHIGMARRRLQ